MRRLLLVVAQLVVALLGGCLAVSAAVSAVLVAVPATARAAAIGACTSTRGTIVAVDFGHWGGPIVRGCGVTASGAPDASGYALLHDGGFTVAGDDKDGPAFVCRLGDAAFDGGAPHPTDAEDACETTPPASAYWSYWLAEPGSDHWIYSPQGVLGDAPVAGEVQLWQFGATDTGGTSGAPAAGLIDQLRAPAVVTVTSPTPSRAPTTAASAPLTSPSQPAVATGHSSKPTGDTSSVAPTTARPTTTASAGPERIVFASSTPATRSRASALPVVLTVVLVALLGGGGLLAARRRRG